ncbi:MAG: hypothetical protein QM656_14885 [Paracoccaceae bacterium]
MTNRSCLALLSAALLAACSPQVMAQKINTRAAESVVRPVVSKGLTGAQADVATRCVLDNATPYELQMLARDVGVEAGSLTESRVLAIIQRPATSSCIAAARGAV